MGEIPVTVAIRKVPNKPNLFEFTIATAVMRFQFRIPREIVNSLRIMIEKALVSK